MPRVVYSSETLDTLRQKIDDVLPALVPQKEPARLYEPVRYVLQAGGKRLRPILLLLVAGCYDVPEEKGLPAALAIELFHNFTLVHDDIMDRSATRRGRPTVHEKWDVDTAILCGDYLMAMSYQQLARASATEDVFSIYYRMVEGLCEGQTFDKAFEGRRHVSVEEYLRMIDGKTGALLGATFEIAACLGRASEAERAELKRAGQEVGRAFQMQDDLLDLVADHKRWGKRIGQDLVEGKKTFLVLRALERAAEEDQHWFTSIVHNHGLEVDQVDEARERMEQLGVFDDARTFVDRYTSSAKQRLQVLPSSDERTTLFSLLDAMSARHH